MTQFHASYKKTTIVFPKTGQEVILGMKKKGFGEGWWNGFGGKLEPGETYEAAAVRETSEEAGLIIKSLRHVANLHFYFDNTLGVVSRAYIADTFEGDPTETDEMRPQIFKIEDLPYDHMWPADKIWIPSILKEAATPLGFIVHFDSDKKFKAIEQVQASLLEDKF